MPVGVRSKLPGPLPAIAYLYFTMTNQISMTMYISPAHISAASGALTLFNPVRVDPWQSTDELTGRTYWYKTKPASSPNSSELHSPVYAALFSIPRIFPDAISLCFRFRWPLIPVHGPEHTLFLAACRSNTTTPTPAQLSCSPSNNLDDTLSIIIVGMPQDFGSYLQEQLKDHSAVKVTQESHPNVNNYCKIRIEPHPGKLTSNVTVVQNACMALLAGMFEDRPTDIIITWYIHGIDAISDCSMMLGLPGLGGWGCDNIQCKIVLYPDCEHVQAISNRL